MYFVYKKMAAFFQVSLPLIAFVVYVKYANGYSAI